ncbi:MAG: hypothetical protein R2741_11380 [Methanolobus sp.]
MFKLMKCPHMSKEHDAGDIDVEMPADRSRESMQPWLRESMIWLQATSVLRKGNGMCQGVWRRKL